MSNIVQKYNRVNRLGSRSFSCDASFIPSASCRVGLVDYRAAMCANNGFRIHELYSSRRMIATSKYSELKPGSVANAFNRSRRKRQRGIPFVIQRGGTSKGVFFKKEDLPECPILRDLVITDAFGSPDVRQIDGLGGADVLTSKVAIVSKRASVVGSENPSFDQYNNMGTENIVADVDYLFGQVEFGNNRDCSGRDSSDVDSANLEKDKVPTGILYDVNCGNISAGVGPYAIEEGLIEVTDDTVTPIRQNSDGASCGDGEKFCQKVRIHNVNTGKVIVADVPVEKIFEEKTEDGIVDPENEISPQSYWAVVEDGDYEIDGVPGTAAYLPLDFSNCVGTLSNGKYDPEDRIGESSKDLSCLLPSGNPRDTVVVDDQSYEVSLVDVANFVVHLDGRQLGLTGKESSTKILNDKEFWNTVRKIRYEAAKLVMREDEITLTKPFTSVVFPFLYDHGYETIRGDIICDQDEQDKSIAPIDFRSFVFFCDHPHKAYPGTASNATASAALIEGTVVSDVMKNSIVTTVGEGRERYREKLITIGHPSGRMSVSSKVKVKMRRAEVISSDERSHSEDTFGPNEISLLRSVIGRTSRRIADGRLYLKAQTIHRLNAEG